MSEPYPANRDAHGPSPRPDRWSTKPRQVYARHAETGGQLWVPDGHKDRPCLDDPQRRTFRELALARLLLDERRGLLPFQTVVEGSETRTHFRHEKKITDEEARQAGSWESIWHQQAKQTVHDWLATLEHPARTLDKEHRGIELPDGRERIPDVFVEFEDGGKIAFECQRSPMGGTSREHTPEHLDGRGEWDRRRQDYEILRETHGIRVVWLVSPGSAVGKIEHVEDETWRVGVFGTYAAELLRAGQSVYWFDPPYRQVGTLLFRRKQDWENKLPGYVFAARDFSRGWKPWLYSDPLAECVIDPATGVFQTPSDLLAVEHRKIAARRARQEVALAEAAQKKREAAAAQRKKDQEAQEEQRQRDLAAQRERTKLWQEAQEKQWKAEQEAEAERRRQQKEASDRLRRQLIGSAVFSLLLIIVILWHFSR